MKIIETKHFPPKGYIAICLFGYCFTRNFWRLTGSNIRHELIHAEQQREMLYIPFFIWYGIEYLIRLCMYLNHKEAYHNISFEREAYSNQYNNTYLKKRSSMAFLKYL